MHEGKENYIGSRLKKVFTTIRNGTFGDLSCVEGIIKSYENG
jgi:hypothetical protein